MQIQIDSEFEHRVPPLSDAEAALLRESLLAEGCREPLLLWGDVLVDGHNRYRVCTEEGIDFDTRELELGTRDDVLDWIDRNQIGRRNLSPDAFRLVLGRIYNRRKKVVGATNQYTAAPQIGDERQRTSGKLAAEYGVSKNTVERAGADAKAVDDAGLGDAVMSGDKRMRDAVDEAKGNYRANGTGQNEWYTPESIIALVREVLGDINVDPASNDEANKVVRAQTYYTEADSGLDHEWHGKIWLNPPYSRDMMPKFVDKLVLEHEAGNCRESIMVSHNNTDTAWFQKIAKSCNAVCFPSRRIKFYRGDDVAAPVNGQVFVYVGDNVDRFVDVFSSQGVCFR